ncbi:MAG: YlxR family protein [Clostridia bacterium]|nr:YlxR family protein [Clostridia bacterium]
MRNPKNTRTCAGCGKKADRHEFIRIGKDSDGNVSIGDTGRGAYLCKSEKCLNAAIKKKRISAILRSAVSDEVYSQLSDIIGCD